MSFNINDYGFDEIVDRFNAYLESEDIWNSVYDTSSAQAFVKMYGWVMDTLSYLVEETIRDLKFGTSSSMQALLEHIKLVGYKAKRNVSAECTVEFSVSNTYTEDVTIPAGTRVQILDMYYITKVQALLLAGNSSVDVDVVQGYSSIFNFTGSGDKDQKYDVLMDGVDNDHVEVYVNGVEWEEVESFYGQDDSNIYVLNTIYGGLRVEFGDSVFGNIPPSGSTIEIKVLISEGASGNINRADVRGELIDPVYAPDSTQVDFSIVTTTLATGGVDAEGVREIKRNTPVFITSGGLYKRSSELTALFETFTEIKQVHVVTEADVPEADRDMRKANIINVYIVPESGYIIDYSTKENILGDLITQEKLLMNTTYNLEEADYLYMRNVITANVPNTVSYTGKKNTLEERLATFYSEFSFGDDYLNHVIQRSLSEELSADGVTYIRDADLYNLRVDTYIIESSESLGWYSYEGYILDIVYDPLYENGIYFTESDEDEVDYEEYVNSGTLRKYAIKSFWIEIDDEVETVDFKKTSTSTSTSVTVIEESGIFSSSNVQGSIDFDTGEYEFMVAKDAGDTVNLIYDYYDEDIPLEFNEYPILHSKTITVSENVDL